MAQCPAGKLGSAKLCPSGVSGTTGCQQYQLWMGWYQGICEHPKVPCHSVFQPAGTRLCPLAVFWAPLLPVELSGARLSGSLTANKFPDKEANNKGNEFSKCWGSRTLLCWEVTQEPEGDWGTHRQGNTRGGAWMAGTSAHFPVSLQGHGGGRHPERVQGGVQLFLSASVSLPHLSLSHPYLAHPGFPLAHGFPPLHCLPQPPLACRTHGHSDRHKPVGVGFPSSPICSCGLPKRCCTSSQG